ncbi:HAD-IIB family hydrolase [Candidatus Woesearchaeota archaeon]|nr:HAD-IIB family hydrolase [Candidatus Woesearchaeota archaeon]
MRVYYASQSFYPHIGGVSTYLLNLCKEMMNNGNEVVEVHLRPSNEEDQAEIKGIEIHRVPKKPIDKEIMKKYSKFKESIYKGSHYNKDDFSKEPQEMEGYEEYHKVNEYFGVQLKELLEHDKADVVHIHDFQLLFAYKYVPRGTPLILTWHIPFIKNMSKPLADFLIKQMKEYDKVVFSSKEYIEAAVSLGFPRENAELIYPLANTDLFKVLVVNKEEILHKYKIPLDSKVILCVQRVDPKSGHEQLVNALPSILKKVPNARLVFVGSESLSNKLSKDREALNIRLKDLIKELGLEENVIFTGNIDYNVLPEIYNCADLVCLCSKNEGFGLSVTEGMACGNPIVGTRVGGIPLQVEDGKNGFLVDVGDVEATSDRITRILTDDDLRARMSQQSLDVVETKLQLSKGIDKHLILYNKLIKSKDELHKIKYLDRDTIKAMVTDLDRTITDEPAKQEFDPKDYDRKLLQELKSLNIDLFLATGRSNRYVKKLCAHFDIWKAVISENGAIIYFPKSKETITTNTFYMAKAKRIIKNLNLPGTIIGKVITSSKLEYADLIKERLGPLADKVKFVINVDELMVLPAGVDKGSGVRVAMRYLNIDLDKTILIGDGENDIDMFHNPGFKVALANAHPNLKKLATETTEHPGTLGVREIIGKLQKKKD